MADQKAEAKAETKDEAEVKDTVVSEYVLKPGKEHRAIVRGERVTLQPGDVIELTASQAASFKDKFFSIEEAEKHADALTKARAEYAARQEEEQKAAKSSTAENTKTEGKPEGKK